MTFPLKLKKYKKIADEHAKSGEKSESIKFYTTIFANLCVSCCTDLICNIAQKIPEFLDMVASSLQRDKYEP